MCGRSSETEVDVGLESDSGFVRGRKKTLLERYSDVYDASTAPEANAVT